MSNYAIYFDYDNETYRLPVNPEQIQVKSSMATEKYEVLKLGQIVMPTRMELKEYSFECELPHKKQHYVETSGGFKGADYYLNIFELWREKLIPVRFIASNGIGDDINTLVLIDDLSITEKAGEEGDKYVSFKLIEYREYAKMPATVNLTDTTAQIVQTPNVEAVSPKNMGTYTVVSGDSLWKIAKTYYGNGAKYTKIYNANKDKIKNPSLIYPGQVLTIPS
ncbi:LysM peptidoglycan-binding domain-containing protein [Clostridium aminobutyricum]|uniref:LysM peptidoglycan-binding domain-containing protein n=1 Tax=Clostridium aminobutyricum TaxID=33953 RepID=A0A939D8K1_CLOAM|nr:LysM peptidoglycan-binding domain-containing protein [Clostridium aminobutyricum]MBN7773146.1 LysM peptidoglycan-binding domain-containing protein [Clostridium aminobutyricum]